MTQKKRVYPTEFKQQAVSLWETSEKSQAEVERELGITQGLLAKWKRKQKMGGERFGRTNLVEQSEAEKELAQLRRENTVLRQEREILKKVVAIFSDPSE
jgi:transposase